MIIYTFIIFILINIHILTKVLLFAEEKLMCLGHFHTFYQSVGRFRPKQLLQTISNEQALKNISFW